MITSPPRGLGSKPEARPGPRTRPSLGGIGLRKPRKPSASESRKPTAIPGELRRIRRGLWSVRGGDERARWKAQARRALVVCLMLAVGSRDGADGRDFPAHQCRGGSGGRCAPRRSWRESWRRDARPRQEPGNRRRACGPDTAPAAAGLPFLPRRPTVPPTSVRCGGQRLHRAQGAARCLPHLGALPWTRDPPAEKHRPQPAARSSRVLPAAKTSSAGPNAGYGCCAGSPLWSAQAASIGALRNGTKACCSHVRCRRRGLPTSASVSQTRGAASSRVRFADDGRSGDEGNRRWDLRRHGFNNRLGGWQLSGPAAGRLTFAPARQTD